MNVCYSKKMYALMKYNSVWNDSITIRIDCKIILSSLIPSPVSHEICHSAFQYINKKLRKLCQKNSHTSFMNLDDIFLKKHNVNMAYYKIDKIYS